MRFRNFREFSDLKQGEGQEQGGLCDVKVPKVSKTREIDRLQVVEKTLLMFDI